jgi:hypothetical protein
VVVAQGRPAQAPLVGGEESFLRKIMLHFPGLRRSIRFSIPFVGRVYGKKRTARFLQDALGSYIT